MADILNAPAKKFRNIKKQVVASAWLVMALVMGGLTLVLWPLSKAAALQTKKTATPEPLVKAAGLGMGQVTHIDTLHELDNEVRPVSFDTLVRDLRDYPPEFKDAKYLKKNKGKWTVQVMDVSEHEIITDYLAIRQDRDKFAYFRYRNESNQPRYVLTYGAMQSPQMAMGAAKTIDFKLPANVRVLPEEIDRYLDMIDNYEISEPVRDLSLNRARKVNLQPTKRELAAKRRAPKPEPSSQTRDKPSATDTPQARNAQQARSGSTATSTEEASSTSSANDSATAIKGSNDTSATISVNEQRNMVNADTTTQREASDRANGDSGETGNAKGDSSTNNGSKSTKRVAKPAESSSKPSASSDKPVATDFETPLKPVKVDSMRTLIEEKNQ